MGQARSQSLERRRSRQWPAGQLCGIVFVYRYGCADRDRGENVVGGTVKSNRVRCIAVWPYVSGHSLPCPARPNGDCLLPFLTLSSAPQCAQTFLPVEKCSWKLRVGKRTRLGGFAERLMKLYHSPVT